MSHQPGSGMYTRCHNRSWPVNGWSNGSRRRVDCSRLPPWRAHCTCWRVLGMYQRALCTCWRQRRVGHANRNRTTTLPAAAAESTPPPNKPTFWMQTLPCQIRAVCRSSKNPPGPRPPTAIGGDDTQPETKMRAEPTIASSSADGFMSSLIPNNVQ